MAANPALPNSFNDTDPLAAKARQCVFLVSNDPETGGIWSYALRQKGVSVMLTGSFAEAMAKWPQYPCDLVLIDVCGPDLDGVELARRLRAEVVGPILLLTPNREESHLLGAYRAGVDECIVKPVSPSLFLAKVHVWLSRSWCIPVQALDDLERGPLYLDATQQEVSLAGEEHIRLTHLEFRVLYLLMSHPNQVLSSDLIAGRVWGQSGEGDSVLVKNVVYRLRRKIEPDPSEPRHLQTVRGRGYLFSSI